MCVSISETQIAICAKERHTACCSEIMALEAHAGRPLELPSEIQYTQLPADPEASHPDVSPRFTRRRIITCAAAFVVTLAALAVAHWAFMYVA